MEVKFSNNGEMDVVEISRPDGSVVALPAEQVNSDGHRYCDVFRSQYEAFKNPPEAVQEQVDEQSAEEPAAFTGVMQGQPGGPISGDNPLPPFTPSLTDEDNPKEHA